MPLIRLEMLVNAPAEVCFDLSRDIDLHIRSTAGSNERAIGGVTTGLIGAGEEVTWEAKHFLIKQRLTSRITAFDRPVHFRDSQVRGIFRRFDHDHFFYAADANRTRMIDEFDYEPPLGCLGRLADLLFLKRYMRRLLERRQQAIKEAAQDELRTQS